MKNFLSKGFSQVELLLGILIISVFFLATARVFYGIGRGITSTKIRTIANNLAQEKIENLKNVSYPRLRVTSLSDLTTYGYDNTYYPPEKNILVGEIPFERRTTIRKVEENSGSLTNLTPSASDTGLKKIEVVVLWNEGSQQAQLEISNLREDPNRKALDGKIQGQIKDQDSLLPINKAQVAIVDNLNWDALTDTNGNYEIRVASGTYQIFAAKTGYFTKNSGSLNVGATPVTCNLELKKMAVGHTTGYVFINEHLVISKVIAKTDDPVRPNEEAVELYNPTSNAITINNGNFKFKYVTSGNNIVDINVNYINTNIPAYGYFLLANTATITLDGLGAPISRPVDAKYSASYGPEPYNLIQENERGGLVITNNFDVAFDSVAWSKSGSGQSAPDKGEETTGVTAVGGLESGKLIFRRSSPTFWNYNKGAAYDSNNNSKDFFGPSPPAGGVWGVTYSPMGTTFTYAPISGTPAPGVIISSNDGLSATTTSYATTVSGFSVAYFDLPGVATGTWTVAAALNNHYQEVSNVVIAENQYTGIPNAGTTPPWPMNNFNYLVLSSAAVYGYVSGQVTAGGSGVSGITVSAGITSTTSGGNGRYYLGLTPESYYITANPGNANANYTQTTTTYPVVVNLGQITSGVNLVISQGGAISGNVKVGSDPIPDVTVRALDGAAQEKGTVVTDASGNYLIEGLSVNGNPYTVAPVLDANETPSPPSISLNVVQGITQPGNDFLISYAFGKISGTVKENSKLIYTGVLLVATTAAIASDPPNTDYSLRSGPVVYYNTDSQSDGTYQLNVRANSGGTTYNVYAWFTKPSGTNGTTTTRRSGTVTVNPGGTATLDFNW